MMRTPADDPKVQLTLDQCNRLPRYAVAELERLSRLATRAIESAEGRPHGNAILNPYASFPVPLGTDPTIEYSLDGNRALGIHCTPNGLVITATGRLSGTLSVQPVSGNVVCVQAVEWR